MKIRDNALTPVVSAAIALLIVTSTVGAVVIWGVPYTNDLRNKSTSENVKVQIDTLSKDLNNLVNSNPGDKKIDTFSMDGGTISTSTKADRTVIMYSHSKDYEFTVTNIEGNNVFIRMIKPFDYPLNYNLSDARLSWSTCFLAGTKVLMADGSYKNIEDITVGEQVASYSEYTNTIESGFVSNVFHHSSNEMPDHYIIINNGLKVTPNHRFYSDGKWVYASDLKVGNHLFSSDGNKDYVIYSIKRVFEKEPCFDLEIEQCHTYFVSIANDGVNVLVHNGGGAGANKPPTFGTPSPKNGSTNQNLTLTWSIPISDLEGNTFKWFINCSNGQKSSATGASNGTKKLSLSGLSYSTKYRVYVNATDPTPGSGTWTRRWYTFTTIAPPINHEPSKPSNPQPSDNAINVPIKVTILQWSPCTDPENESVSYEVYFGTATLSKYPKQNQTWFNPGTLNYNTHYWWKVIAYDPEGNRNESDIWNFYTEIKPNNPPNMPIYSSPSNHATNVSTITRLFWNCSDSDGDILTYDVYLGKSTPPTLERSNWAYNSLALLGLESNTKYYWKIVAKDEHGATTTGPIWDFKTETAIKSITVISPNGGELWLINSTQNITWTSQGINGLISIKIYASDIRYGETIATNIPNTGSYQWLIPGYIPTDGTYKIQIWSADDSTIYDESDNYFSIHQQTSITVISPNGGETWYLYNLENITWTSQGINGLISIKIYASDIRYGETIATNIPNTGSYQWEITKDIPTDDTYKINIWSADDSTIYDESDNYFSIHRPSITVISPNGGETWRENGTYYINWITNGFGPNGSITILSFFMQDYYGNDYLIQPIVGSISGEINSWKINLSWIMCEPAPPGYYKILIVFGLFDIYDYSDGFFTIYPEGSYVLTRPPENNTNQATIFVGKLENLSGSVRFRYREQNTTEWKYSSEWHGDFTNEIFKETFYGLSPGVNYEYQAGFKNDMFELWGSFYYFTTMLHEGFTNCYLVDTKNIGGDNWSIDLSCLPSISGTVVIDLYTSQPSVVHFGTIWIYDSNSLTYMKSEGGKTEGYAFEKGGILKYEEGKWHVEDTTQISNWTNLFSIHVPQTIFSSFSESASSNNVLKFKIYSNLQSSYNGESKQIYNMRIQFDGDHKYEWRDYLKGKYLFEDDSIATEYPSLKYVPSENGVCLALAYSTIALVLN